MLEKNVREKELRNMMAAEFFKDQCMDDYNEALSDNYEFTYCPDEYEFLADNMDDFNALCDEFSVGDKDICNQCWKGFLRGEKC